ncbi:MAG: hypothetical protein UW30_C0008G0006 [Candidatus Giovannonibacteria bacterium GW2011_GWA2_44_13b]|uniref:Uncharacterized protein n=2 Tax=Candidatus Giovannoniibacteriota TaxID=1752738 RepID=A0A0G1JBJ6_9BACT|nr:MAG: hypothetical protein UW30_C0008G0006 [Candidatus Giovannonibacteria bacterium GW2011_GWA2_44_13b]OGF82656.1 MAG: hypothetical protein A2924_00630 [Candidatus Giovannonibacteria bacterium RIFCSPLOWO2_01_FULL_44_16]
MAKTPKKTKKVKVTRKMARKAVQELTENEKKRKWLIMEKKINIALEKLRKLKIDPVPAGKT